MRGHKAYISVNITIKGIKMVKTWKIILGAGATSIVAILAILMTVPGVTITVSGDIKCMGNSKEPCVSYFNITSSNYSLKFYNASQKLDFSPDIKSYTIYRRSSTGNWYKTKFPINMTKGTLYQFKIVAYKNNITDIIKWSVSAGDAEEDPIWDSYTADDFFIELVSNKADLSYGEAIFKVRNPTTFNFTVDAINNRFGAKFMKYLGNDVNSWNLQVLMNKSNSDNMTDYSNICNPYIDINGTQNDNCTQVISGWHWNNYTTQTWKDIKLNDMFVSGKTYTIKLTATWNAGLGQQSIEWFPQITIEGTTLEKKW